ncbi:sel1 repeat family protein, partial [Aliarcobacter butzleri]|nr:sel1 repeat family protein [Aliarcobacter butzleri]
QGNYVDGVKYLTLAGENGVKTAQNELSILYSNGQYIEPDLEKSEFWTLQYQENNDDFMKRIYGR